MACSGTPLLLLYFTALLTFLKFSNEVFQIKLKSNADETVSFFRQLCVRKAAAKCLPRPISTFTKGFN
jgi:hypothetical protein